MRLHFLYKLLLAVGFSALLATGTAFAAPILSENAHGHDVLKLQKELKRTGYLTDEPNGIFDTHTKNAVLAFQREENLAETGIVDRAMWQLLRKKPTQKASAIAAMPTVDQAASLPEKTPLNEAASVSEVTPPVKKTIPPLAEKQDLKQSERLINVKSANQSASALAVTSQEKKAPEPPEVTPQVKQEPSTRMAAPAPRHLANIPDVDPAPWRSANSPPKQPIKSEAISAEEKAAPKTAISADSEKPTPSRSERLLDIKPINTKATSAEEKAAPKTAISADSEKPALGRSERLLDIKPINTKATSAPRVMPTAPKMPLPDAQPVESAKDTLTNNSKAPFLTPRIQNAPEGLPILLSTKVAALIETAKKYIGTPYQFGGTTPEAFDCSGYLQYVFKENGITIPRTADEQFKLGRNISTTDLVTGDLVFFETSAAGASHCGIYLGDGKFIHASTSKGVRIDELSSSYWRTHYYASKHIVDE